ncbi:ABC transporter permease [Flavihumibacter petaseus]|uniref:Putative ABC transporter permease protein n=1 Tax=Flavihumibacter petaseus NBRC 106054 TaxID=1220578 RepID=A0A0E9N031_9BACT|nr:ABC transporter permease [Flavihumibacter petaseus]GAO43184.1 putative ABC transporter permease protein [Flavihumibacter petaseus NBRC 106054]
MFKNLLLVALRNFRKDKWYSLINILGLTIGITFGMFLIFYIKDELSFDKFYPNADRIYRINSIIKEADRDTMRWAIAPFPAGPALASDYPEVEEAVRFVGSGRTMFKNGATKLYEEKVFFADSNVFKVFQCKFIEGNPKTALQEPNTLVLSKSSAIKFFGNNQRYLGKTLENINGKVYKVTGVMEDVPRNSHFLFNVLVSRKTLPADFGNNWGSFDFYTYVLLKPGTSAAAFTHKMKPMYDKYLASIFEQYNIKIRFEAQPITTIHLHSTTVNEPEELGSMSYIYIFSAVAFFMLLIACINYMNLTTARSARRAKEIGIRKVTGSNKSQLVMQFLIESTLTAFFALLISIGLIAIFLPLFNNIAGKHISFLTLFRPDTILILLGVVLFVGIVGGSYPAFYLSKFNPISVLKGSLSKGSSNVNLRRSLVVLQFSISMIMLICTWVVYKQLNYLRSKDLGFDKDKVMNASAIIDRDIRSAVISFKNEMRKNPGVQSVSSSYGIPGGGISFNLFSVETKNGFTDKGVDVYSVDEDYVKTLGIKMAKGRNFSGIADTLHSILVNEKLVKEFGWGEEALGKRVKYPGDTSGNYLEVIGVVKDFNQKSLYNEIAPLILVYTRNGNLIQMKLSGGNIPGTVAGIEKTWKNTFPDIPFQYTFLDQDFDSQYAADQKRGKIFTVFSVLTILITCLGLLGLIAFTTEQRQKEISIRKVLGASVGEIIPLVSRNFVFLVGLSCIIAFPVAGYFMTKWLKIFPYNTGLSVSPFILSALVVLLITLMTTIFHTVRAALSNPVESLRSE